MSVSLSTNREVVERYIDGFNRSDHAQILACLTDDVTWEIPGMFKLAGKDAFDAAIESDEFEGNPTIVLTRVLEEDDVVVAEGSVTSRRKDGGTLNAVFCDVFEIRDGLISRLVSYLTVLS